ncbi:hypothetical protein ANN_14271 [Periplaneta americana]|uniref:Uncharacterized protein n=1 Tax=Periplaneta americana TaxID=6978 RepID=A0ABQ8SVU8_PERAM|nr:hypothetical protein ANN_14271 [Periplaneta americana]
MAGLCEGGNEPPGSLKAIFEKTVYYELKMHCDILSSFRMERRKNTIPLITNRIAQPLSGRIHPEENRDSPVHGPGRQTAGMTMQLSQCIPLLDVSKKQWKLLHENLGSTTLHRQVRDAVQLAL